MDIIILAAGKGERLLPLTRHTPKCLIEISDGTTLLETQLRNMSREKIGTVYLVVGYLADQVEAKLHSYLKEFNIDIQIIFNPFYAISNNFMSMWLARPYMTDDFVILNGDVIFHNKVLHDLMKQDEDVCMVIDKKDTYDADDMKIRLSSECVTSVSKKIPVEESDGESIGMIRFIGSGARQFKNKVDKLARNPEGLNIFWLGAVQALMNSGRCVNFLEIPQDHWAEIDFHPDLKAVRTNVFQYIPKSILDSDQ